MKHIATLLFTFLVFGCATSISKEALDNLNGYWEIAEVEFSNGQKKTYAINPSVDYIELKEMKGFKKKMHPKFDGTYDTSNDAEHFTVIEKDGTFLFSYKNDLSEWEEQIIALEENSFSIINEENITYTYKRYEPIKIE
ncbi:lipocalin family protein [uncultured Croceitalea sp.]|uniref:lipocalin family protein n=1 Tax=uncultured Croceitalea sp. TaxID=1798908 RepID=UPI0033057A91